MQRFKLFIFILELLRCRYIAELAENNKLCIPVPSFSMISGGRYSDNNLSCQEFAILPIGMCIHVKLNMCTTIY